MNTHKKLNKIVEKKGDELKNKNSAFYSQMVNTYYAEEQKPKTSTFSFFTNKRVLAIMASCLVLVIGLSLGLGFGLRGARTKLPTTAETSDVRNLLPENVEIVQYVQSTGVAVEKLTRTSNVVIMFGGNRLSLSSDVNLYQDIDAVSNECNFYYVTHSDSKGGFYRLQLIINENYQQASRLTDKTKVATTLNGIEFTYSVIYAENEKLVYFFAEATSNGERLLIDYTTVAQDCENSFLDFLNSITL